MDIASLNSRAERVSTIFNILANVVAVLGGLITVVLFFTAFSSSVNTAAGLAGAVGAAIYTVLAWAAIQLSSLVAGYIHAPTMGPEPQ